MMGGVFSVLFDTDVTVPEWTKQASKKLLEGMGLNGLADLSADTENKQFSKQIGKITGIAEKWLKTPAPPSSKMGKIENDFISPFVEFAKSVVASKAEPEEAVTFFTERNQSEKSVEKMENLSQRTKIYMIICFHWQEIQKFKSTGELHTWLLSLKGKDGACFIAPQTESRETRKICLSIGLKFQNRWQKAKNPPLASESKGEIIS